jgi:hypothetical protein
MAELGRPIWIFVVLALFVETRSPRDVPKQCNTLGFSENISLLQISF